MADSFHSFSNSLLTVVLSFDAISVRELLTASLIKEVKHVNKINAYKPNKSISVLPLALFYTRTQTKMQRCGVGLQYTYISKESFVICSNTVDVYLLRRRVYCYKANHNTSSYNIFFLAVHYVLPTTKKTEV